VNKFREVKDMLGASYNKEIIRKKSIRKEVRYKQNAERIKDWPRKSQANLA
jgi:hypothetical protein